MNSSTSTAEFSLSERGAAWGAGAPGLRRQYARPEARPKQSASTRPLAAGRGLGRRGAGDSCFFRRAPSRPMPMRTTRRSPRRRLGSTSARLRAVRAKHGRPEAIRQQRCAASLRPAALKDTQKAFAATVEAWSVVEPIRFGPVAQEHRFERIFYWPDPKGLGTRQIREVRSPSRTRASRSRQVSSAKAWRYRASPRSNISSMATARRRSRRAAPKGRSAAASPKPSPAISPAWPRRSLMAGRMARPTRSLISSPVPPTRPITRRKR